MEMALKQIQKENINKQEDKENIVQFSLDHQNYHLYIAKKSGEKSSNYPKLHPYETTVGQSTKCLGKNTFLLEEIDLSNDLEKTQSDMSNKESQVTQCNTSPSEKHANQSNRSTLIAQKVYKSSIIQDHQTNFEQEKCKENIALYKAYQRPTSLFNCFCFA